MNKMPKKAVSLKSRKKSNLKFRTKRNQKKAIKVVNKKNSLKMRKMQSNKSLLNTHFGKISITSRESLYPSMSSSKKLRIKSLPSNDKTLKNSSSVQVSFTAVDKTLFISCSRLHGSSNLLNFPISERVITLFLPFISKIWLNLSSSLQKVHLRKAALTS